MSGASHDNIGYRAKPRRAVVEQGALSGVGAILQCAGHGSPLVGLSRRSRSIDCGRRERPLKVFSHDQDKGQSTSMRSAPVLRERGPLPQHPGQDVAVANGARVGSERLSRQSATRLGTPG